MGMLRRTGDRYHASRGITEPEASLAFAAHGRLPASLAWLIEHSPKIRFGFSARIPILEWT